MARAPDGRVIFVSGAVGGETAELEITQDNLRFLRARVLRLLSPGPGRVEPPCPHFAACGGCALQYLEPQAQLAAKAHAFAETLARLGRVDLAQVELGAPLAVADRGYRERARWVIDPSGASGFRQERGRAVVAIDACLVQSPRLDEALRLIRAALADPRLRPRASAELAAVTNGEEVLLAPEHGLQALARALPGEGPIRVATEEESIPALDGLGPLLLSPRVFAQSGREGTRALAAEVEALLPQGEAVELYSGSGNLTRVLARGGRRVRAFESEARAVALARQVAPPQVEVRAATAEEALAELAGSSVSALLVDPPRAGLSPEVIAGIAGLKLEAMIYVSCDPATFARDVARLADHGLALERARLFDLYPHTAHAEVVGRLRPRARQA